MIKLCEISMNEVMNWLYYNSEIIEKVFLKDIHINMNFDVIFIIRLILICNKDIKNEICMKENLKISYFCKLKAWTVICNLSSIIVVANQLFT